MARPARLRPSPLGRQNTPLLDLGKLIEPLPLEPSQELGLLPELRLAAFQLLRSLAFQLSTLTCLLLNAVVIGLGTDLPDLPWLPGVERFFLAVFTFELVLRCFVYGPGTFFCDRPARRGGGADQAWNFFDAFVVVCGWLQELVARVEKAQRGEAILLRTLRVLRLLRLLRLIRVVRFLRQLYLLACGIREGAAAIFWAAVFSGGIIYLCAVVLVRCCRAVAEDSPHRDFLHERFASVPGAMFTLFEIMACPSLEAYRQALEEWPLLAAFVVVFVVFMSLGVNGVLTGVISQSIMEKNWARLEAQRQERESKRRWLEAACSELFDNVVGDAAGRMSLQEFTRCSWALRTLLEAAEVRVVKADLLGLFPVMDYSGSGALEKVDFVQGVLELCEDVRPMSMMEMHCQVVKAQLQAERYRCRLEAALLQQRSAPQDKELESRLFMSEGPPGPEEGELELRALERLQRRLAALEGRGIKGLALLGRKLSRLACTNSQLLEEAVRGT